MRVIGGWLCTPRTSTAEVTFQVTKRGKIAKRVLTIPAGWIREQWDRYGPAWLDRHGRDSCFALRVLGEPHGN